MHGGNPGKVYEQFGLEMPKSVIDLSTGLNPFGFPKDTRLLVDRHISSLSEYPDPDYIQLKRVLAENIQVKATEIVLGNGASELILAVYRALAPKRIIAPVPSFIDYHRYAKELSIHVQILELKEEQDFHLDFEALRIELSGVEKGSLFVMANPNNPTANYYDFKNIENLVVDLPHVNFLIDESYLGLLTAPSDRRPIYDNLIILRSLTKTFALPGLRLGYALTSEKMVEKIGAQLPSWNISSLAAAVYSDLLQKEKHFSYSIHRLSAQRSKLIDGISSYSQIKLYESTVSFILMQYIDNDPLSFYQRLLKRGIVVRLCADYRGLDSRFFRVQVPNEEDLPIFLSVIEEILSPKKSEDKMHIPHYHRSTRKTKAIMFQGTSSNAGKSLIATAMCRALSDEGYNVAPFKAQNMSLNSYVTKENGEMGRAQVLQAQAARVEPQVLMNPILLKPNSDNGSQLIILGQAQDNYTAREYFSKKRDLRSIVQSSYDKLAEDFDVIVLEGAGSPGEVNLKKYDLVNMSMAKYANSPVILVGDIDRGGVYASFMGHMQVMEEWERNLLSGFLVNKFRGDKSFLDEAHDYVAKYSGKEVLGIIPFVRNHGLPEEDGLNFDQRFRKPKGQGAGATIRIGIIWLPHLSNNTDFDGFLQEPSVELTQVKHPDQIDNLHALVIPGSKNVISDLEYLYESGLAEAIMKRVKTIVILGICGGFQMLGSKIDDPHCIESKVPRSIKALDLLPLHTELQKQKVLKQRKTQLLGSSTTVNGYEIHHGRSTFCDDHELFKDAGLGCRKDNIWGTYLHGVLEDSNFRRAFLNSVIDWNRKANFPVNPGFVGNFGSSFPLFGQNEFLEQSINSFTEVFLDSVDYKTMKRNMGL